MKNFFVNFLAALVYGGVGLFILWMLASALTNGCVNYEC